MIQDTCVKAATEMKHLPARRTFRPPICFFSAPGVYFGWAALEEVDGQGGEGGHIGKSGGVEGGPWKLVANVGYSPTFAGQENAEKIVEGHLIGYEGVHKRRCWDWCGCGR